MSIDDTSPRSVSSVHAGQPRVILLGGCQRSGTTLIQTVIENALPDCTQLAECHVICDLFQSYAKRVDEWEKTGDYFSSSEQFRYFCRDTFNRVLQNVLQLHPLKNEQGETRQPLNVVLKDPNFSRVLPALKELVPEAHVVLVVRDPRDIAASFVRIGVRQAKENVDNYYTRRDMKVICGKITDCYAPYLDNHQSLPDVLVAKYEDVCRNNSSFIGELYRQIGVESQHVSGPLIWSERQHRHTNETWIGELEGKDPSAQHVNDFASVLTEKEIRVVEKRCSKVMEHFQYNAD